MRQYNLRRFHRNSLFHNRYIEAVKESESGMGCNAGTVSLYASGDDGISSIDLGDLYRQRKVRFANQGPDFR